VIAQRLTSTASCVLGWVRTVVRCVVSMPL
jgi:hypothetical protein